MMSQLDGATSDGDCGESRIKSSRKSSSKKGGLAPSDGVTGPRKEKESPVKLISTRKLFGADEESYIMDAKTIGNIGRYLNHSCNPNVFVQNVFVDTHDLRLDFTYFSYHINLVVKCQVPLGVLLHLHLREGWPGVVLGLWIRGQD